MTTLQSFLPWTLPLAWPGPTWVLWGEVRSEHHS